MLIDAKMLLQTNLLKMLIDAYMTQFESCSDPDGGSANSSANAKMQQKANDFAQAAAKPTATAIYNFVKEIGIIINIPPSIIAPPLPPLLPGGPCTGVIPMVNIKIS